VRPVLEDVEGAGDERGAVGGDLQLVDGLVEAGVGVEVGAESHADALEVIDDLLLLEVLRAVERHVLDEVGEPLLVVVLEHRAGVHRQAQLGPLLGAPVGADVVAEPVRQSADPHGRIHR
jgi:hypothetical protein